MFMYFIVWPYSKDLLHHDALKFNLVVGKFQEGKQKVFHTFSKKWFLPSDA